MTTATLIASSSSSTSRFPLPPARRFDLVKDHPTTPGFELYRVRMDRLDGGDLDNDGNGGTMRVRIYRNHRLMRDETVSVAKARCIWARWAKRGLRRW